jgi:hypothetical protein
MHSASLVRVPLILSNSEPRFAFTVANIALQQLVRAGTTSTGGIGILEAQLALRALLKVVLASENSAQTKKKDLKKRKPSSGTSMSADFLISRWTCGKCR